MKSKAPQNSFSARSHRRNILPPQVFPRFWGHKYSRDFLFSTSSFEDGGCIEFLGYTPETEALLEKERQEVIIAHQAWLAKQVQTA